jgi:hypothetical protein
LNQIIKDQAGANGNEYRFFMSACYSSKGLSEGDEMHKNLQFLYHGNFTEFNTKSDTVKNWL